MSGRNFPERVVIVTCDGTKKRMTLNYNGFEGLKGLLRDRFNNLRGKDIVDMTVIYEDRQVYKIENDGDLQDNWNEMKEIQVFLLTAEERKLQMKIVVDEGSGRRYNMLETPPGDSSFVQKAREDLLHIIKFDTAKDMTMSVGLARCLGVLSEDENLIMMTDAVALSIEKSCLKLMTLMFAYKTTSNAILRTQRSIVIELVDNGDCQMAFEIFTNVSKLSQERCTETLLMVQTIDACLGEISALMEYIKTRTDIADTRKRKEEEEKSTEKSLTLIKTHEEECRRKSTSFKVAGAGAVTGGVLAATGISLLVDNPVFLPVAAVIAGATGIGGVAVGVGHRKITHNEEKVTYLKKKAHEIMDIGKRSSELKRDLTNIKLDIARLQSLKDAVHKLWRSLTNIKSLTQNIHATWENLVIFCKDIKTEEDKMEAQLRHDKTRYAKNPTFGYEVLCYYAQWVAARDLFSQYHTKLGEVTKELSECVRKKLSKKDADEYINNHPDV